MRNKLFVLIHRVIDAFLNAVYLYPKMTIKLICHKEFYINNSYYPEKKRKSSFRIFIEQLRQVWRYGAPNDFYFMYGLDVKSRIESQEYLNYAPFMKRRDELNQSSRHNSTCILRDKFYFGIFAEAIGVKTPRIVAYIRKGSVYMPQYRNEVTLEQFILSGKYDVFCKLVDGECGEGIFTLTINKGDLLKDGKDITVSQLKEIIDGAIILCQERVSQHSEMNRLYDKSANTIRLITVRSLRDGEVRVLPSILRIGANGSFVDNTSQGGIAVGFNLSTGRLNEFGFYKPKYGLKVNKHPNSEVVFKDFTIPYINEAIDMAKKFHSFLPDIHSVGWDIAISEDGPTFIEGNDNWEINGPQVGNKGLRREFEEYFYNDYK